MMATMMQTAGAVDDKALCLATAVPTSDGGLTSFYLAVLMIFAFGFLLGHAVRDVRGRPALEQPKPRSAARRTVKTQSKTKFTHDNVQPRCRPLGDRDQGAWVD